MHEHRPSIELLPDEFVGNMVVNGLKIQYRRWGSSEAFPIVLLHGLRGYAGTWRSFAQLCSHDYQLIAIDQRGRGGSDWDPGHNYYTDAYLADLEAIVDRLALECFVLLGHSMGGTTSYVYAANHAARLAALIIEDMAPGASIKGSGATRVVGEMTTLPDHFPSWEAAYIYWRTQRPSVDERSIQERMAETMCAGQDGCIHWRYDANGIKHTRINPDSNRIVDLWPVIDRITTPTLVIRGANSDFCPEETVQIMTRRNPNISYVTVPGAGHYVHDDNLSAFTAHVTDFLRGGPMNHLQQMRGAYQRCTRGLHED